MRISRKRFLQLSGLSFAAAAGRKAFAFLSSRAKVTEPASNAAPAAPPRRWALLVDAAKCRQKAGCTDCTVACHRAHNVPSFKDPKREVKWIWEVPFKQAFPSEENAYTVETLRDGPVPVLCNHCENPPCARVCPTKATWKRDDGIVMMDWHRCIGCRYCMAACPYGSRSFNWFDPRTALVQINPSYPTRTKGVVEKCTFCEERLVKGQQPACVEACPQKALVFGNVNDPNSEVARMLRERFSIRRKPELGTKPQVYYII